MRIEASGVAPSPSRLPAEIPPRPSAQGNTMPPATSRPWDGFPGRLRTVSRLRPGAGSERFFALPHLHLCFFLYDRDIDKSPGPDFPTFRTNEAPGQPTNRLLAVTMD